MAATPMSVEAYARKAFLTVSQRRELQESIKRNEMALEGRQLDGRPLPTVTGLPPTDLELLRENIARESAMLAQGTPQSLTPLESRQRFKWMRDDLEPKIKRGMPSFEQMERPLPVNIDTHMAWERHCLKDVLAWKAVRRELDPTNEEPNFTNVELLRSTTPPAIDLRQYWQNYDLIQWELAQEEVLEPLDDESFQRFCLLKAAEWAPANIQRELGWEKAHYEQAMGRLREMMAKASINGAGDESSNGSGPSSRSDEEILTEALGVKPPSPQDQPPAHWKDFASWVRTQLTLRDIPLAACARAVQVMPATLQRMVTKHVRMRDPLRSAITQFFQDYDANPLMIQDYLRGAQLRDWLDRQPHGEEVLDAVVVDANN